MRGLPVTPWSAASVWGHSPPPAPQHAYLIHRDPARGAPRRPFSRPRQGAAAALSSVPVPAALYLRGASAQQSQGTRALFWDLPRRRSGVLLAPGINPRPPRVSNPGTFFPRSFPSFPRVSWQGMPPSLEIAGLPQTPPLLISKLPKAPDCLPG